MVDYIETFDLNVHMHGSFDCDDIHLELGNLAKDYGLVVNSILTLGRPFAFKSIAMPNDLDEKIEIAWKF